MSEPWFRKHPWFLALPVRREGVVVMLALVSVTTLGGLAWASLGGWGSLLGIIGGVVFMAAGLIGFAVVEWKTERNYGLGPDPRPDGRTVTYGCIAQAIFMIVSFVVITVLINLKV